MVMLSRVTWRENRSQPSYIKLTKSTQLVTRRSYLLMPACMRPASAYLVDPEALATMPFITAAITYMRERFDETGLLGGNTHRYIRLLNNRTSTQAIYMSTNQIQ